MVNQPRSTPTIAASHGRHVPQSCATDIIEPGSSIKPFVVAAALQSGRYDAASIVDTSPGFIRVGTKVIEDEHQLGPSAWPRCWPSPPTWHDQDCAEPEPQQIWTTLTQLGFGRVTASEFPGESAGVLSNYSSWRPIGIPHCRAATGCR